MKNVFPRRWCSTSVVLLLVVAAGCGGTSSSPLVQNPQGTTLVASIGPVQGTAGAVTGQYRQLGYGAPWDLVTRTDLASAGADRAETPRESLVSFIHITDAHLMDAQSPARVPFLRKYAGQLPPNLAAGVASAYRPQEALTTQVADSMVQKINSLSGGPALGGPFAGVVFTGDTTDGRSMNALTNFVALMDGSEVTADTSGQGYVGVQDDYVPPGRPDIYAAYYHPNPAPSGVQPDDWKTDYGFPTYSGLLTAATQNFTATGLSLPWYTCFGNHDGLLEGSVDVSDETLLLVDAFATGTTMLLDLPSDLTVAQILACYDNPTEECIHEIVLDVVFNSPRRDIPANVERSLYTREEFIQAFIDSPATPGPAGHGFDVVNEVEDRVYYVFDLSDDVRGIILDSVTIGIGDDGAIGTNQAAWLEDELAKVNAYYYDADGDVVLTGNPDQLVVIFSHHDSETLDNTDVSDDDPDPVKLTPAEFEALLHRYPNVILWANGHEHWNRVWAHADPLGWTGGFWEVNTASFIDYPQQARDIEIVENADGTLSIFAVLIDHLASPTTSAHDLDTLGIAAISRELAANDPAKDIDTQIGEPSDRNVELLINKPF